MHIPLSDRKTYNNKNQKSISYSSFLANKDFENQENVNTLDRNLKGFNKSYDFRGNLNQFLSDNANAKYDNPYNSHVLKTEESKFSSGKKHLKPLKYNNIFNKIEVENKAKKSQDRRRLMDDDYYMKKNRWMSSSSSSSEREQNRKKLKKNLLAQEFQQNDEMQKMKEEIKNQKNELSMKEKLLELKEALSI